MDGEKLKDMLPDHLKMRSITESAIPKTYSLKTVLNQMIEMKGLDCTLKSKGKSCYKAYELGEIEDILLESYKEEWPCIVKAHLLSKSLYELGANAIAIYLIAFISENYGPGKEIFSRAVKELEITKKENLIRTIWKVGQCDGQYLGVLNADGTIRDKNFFRQWTRVECGNFPI